MKSSITRCISIISAQKSVVAVFLGILKRLERVFSNTSTYTGAYLYPPKAIFTFIHIQLPRIHENRRNVESDRYMNEWNDKRINKQITEKSRDE